jgi:hypothetical protein
MDGSKDFVLRRWLPAMLRLVRGPKASDAAEKHAR